MCEWPLNLYTIQPTQRSSKAIHLCALQICTREYAEKIEISAGSAALPRSLDAIYGNNNKRVCGWLFKCIYAKTIWQKSYAT